MGFPSVFLFCTEKSHGLYGEKRKLRPYIETKLQFFTWFIWRKTFLQDFLRYTNKINGVSIFVSIPHCPMDYCIPPYSTVFIEQGFACNSVE